MEAELAKGHDAVEYIKQIDVKLYARHAFPLPRFGRVTSNPAEQSNSGLLPIRFYAPFKLLVEIWYYCRQRFRDRQREANLITEPYTADALRKYNEHMENFGEWQVIMSFVLSWLTRLLFVVLIINKFS